MNQERLNKETRQRFFEKVDINGPMPEHRPDLGRCWIWKGSNNGRGYGNVSIDGVKYYTHRYFYEKHKGKISKGLHLDHLCMNKICCNPDHLEAVTQRVNNIRSNGASGINHRKTHCKRGHEFTEQNIYRVKNRNIRICKKCFSKRSKERYVKSENPQNKNKKECLNGHPFSRENTYFYPNGRRSCRTCSRKKLREFKEKKRNERTNN